MPKYEAPSSAPENPREFQIWMLDELRHLSDAMSEPESDSVLLKQWNEDFARLGDGLLAYFDGTNFDPGDGKGIYFYDGAAAAWVKLGGGGGLSASAAEEITGGWLFSTVLTRFTQDIELENGKKIHIEGTVAGEFIDIKVVSSNNSVLFSQTGLSSGGLHGAWWQMPIRIRDGHPLVLYDGANADSISMAHNGTDLNVSTTNTRHFAFLSLTGRVRDGGFDLMQIRVSTTAALEQLINAINTSSDKVAGYMLFNTTTSKPVWAVGPNDNSVWVDATGTTVHTPV